MSIIFSLVVSFDIRPAKRVSSRLVEAVFLLRHRLPSFLLVLSLFLCSLLVAPELTSVGFRMASELLNVVRTNYIVWPLASYLIFRRVPEALRVLASNFVAVFWNAYLCSRIA